MPKPPREKEPLGIGCYIDDLEEPGKSRAQGAQAPNPDPKDAQSEPGGSEIPRETSDGTAS